MPSKICTLFVLLFVATFLSVADAAAPACKQKITKASCAAICKKGLPVCKAACNRHKFCPVRSSKTTSTAVRKLCDKNASNALNIVNSKVAVDCTVSGEAAQAEITACQFTGCAKAACSTLANDVNTYVQVLNVFNKEALASRGICTAFALTQLEDRIALVKIQCVNEYHSICG